METNNQFNLTREILFNDTNFNGIAGVKIIVVNVINKHKEISDMRIGNCFKIYNRGEQRDEVVHSDRSRQ